MNTFLKQVCLNSKHYFFQSPCQKKCVKKSALEELFENEEDLELLQATTSKSCAISKAEHAHKEIEIYKGLPSVSSGQDPVAWGWGKRDTVFPYCLPFQTHTCVCRPHRHHLREFSPLQDMP